MKSQTFYYSDEVNDDFAGTHVVREPLPSDYEYDHKGFWQKFKRFTIYFILVRPITFIYNRLIKRVKYVNKKVMKPYKKQGCFIYGNHTSMVVDAFNPAYISYPRPADIIINADALYIKGAGWIIKPLGGLPIAESFAGMKKFNAAVADKIAKRHWIAIYPEAHIWHYYTKIRNFPAVSFDFPVKLKTPVFSYTMTYRKKKHSKYPKRVVCIDGPFFPDETLNKKDAAKKLRDEVYNAMCARAETSDCEYIKYVYRPEEENDNEVHSA